jgi:DNA repair protein RadC
VKPGRKLVEQGAAACSEAELLAILIGSGGRGYSALDAAQALLARHGSLAALMDRPLAELAGVRGIKGTRAIRIAAAYEFAARLIRELEHQR